MTPETDLDTLDRLCASLEQIGEDLFEHTQDMFADATITQLTDDQYMRQYSTIDPERVSLEDWEQTKAFARDASSAMGKVANVSGAAFKKFLMSALAQIDQSARVDLRNTEALLVKTEGDGYGKLHMAKLAARLSMHGQPVAHFAGMFDELILRSQTIATKLLSANDPIMREMRGIVDRMDASPEDFERKAKQMLKAAAKIRPMEQILNGPVLLGQWPGGFTVSRKVRGYNDFDLNTRRLPKDNPGIADVLRRSECEELLRQVSRFIQTNRDLAIRQDHSFQNSASWIALNLRFVCGREAAKGRNVADLRRQMIELSQTLRSKTYLDNHVIVRRLLARNVEVIRYTLQYIRASIQQFR